MAAKNFEGVYGLVSKKGLKVLCQAVWDAAIEYAEARPTVRAKRPVQQAKVKTEPALCEGMYHGSCKGETMCNPTNACFVPARH